MKQPHQSPRLNFTIEEFATRLKKTQTAMQSAQIDTLVISDPSNMHWLTGYDGWSFYVHQCVIVPAQGEPIWFGRGIDASGARLRSWLHEDNIVEYSDHYVMNTEHHPMDFLSQMLTSRGLSSGIIGVEMDNYYYSAAAHASLTKGLPNATLKDCHSLVNWQRAVKSPQELDYMRKAGQIVGAMHERIRATARPGLAKNELVAEIYDASLRGIEGIAGDYPAIVPLLPSGVDASASHLTWDERPLKRGEGTFFEIAGCYKRYHCPLCRTMYIGKPDSKFLEAEKAVIEGLEAGLEQARPGNACEDISNAFLDVMKKYGINKDSRTGYPVGLSYPPDWGERTMSLRPGDKNILQPNMTFHFMPGLWLDDWGLEITETIVITENGAECLSNVPREIFIVD